MQKCLRLFLANGDNLPDSVLLLPNSYSSCLPPVGKDVDMKIGGKGIICLNTVVIQERLASCESNIYFEHCLSAGGNVSTVVLDQRLPPDSEFSLVLSIV